MAKLYEVHVASDETHWKLTVDAEDNFYLTRHCENGAWKDTEASLPYPTEMIETGPGAGPRHCPVCGGDAISTTI